MQLLLVDLLIFQGGAHGGYRRLLWSISFGDAFFVARAWPDRDAAARVESFFNSDQKVGHSRTAANSWGIGFSFANGLWFCIFLGYSFGWIGMLFQALWSASVFLFGALMAEKVAKLVKDGKTIHGYLGTQYGASTQFWASIATSIGYILNIGFELYFGSWIISIVLGLPPIWGLWLGLGTGIVAALYCMIGGYDANVRSDKIQNIIGSIAATLLLALLLLSPHVEPKTLMFAEMPGLSFSIGLAVFLALFNLVDMANWQMALTNSRLPSEQLKEIPRAFRSSAVRQMFYPSLAGVLIGLLLRNQTGLTDDQLLPHAFSLLSPHGNYVVAFILFGLLCCSLSTADTYLMVATQTIVLDLLRRAPDTLAKDAAGFSHNQKLIIYSRFILIILAVGSVAFFYLVLQSIGKANVVILQFVMYGAALALLAPTLWSLLAGEHIWSLRGPRSFRRRYSANSIT